MHHLHWRYMIRRHHSAALKCLYGGVGVHFVRTFRNFLVLGIHKYFSQTPYAI